MRIWTRCVASIFLLAQLTPSTLAAQGASGPDTPEPGTTEAIRAATTDPKFLSPWVAYVPQSATVPSPTRYLGHIAGAPGELSNTTKVYGYFRELDKASDRVQIEIIGKSEEGRDILLVAIADEDGIRDLAKFKEATAALADPRKTTPERAEEIIAAARPIYYFNAGLHSTETGSPEMVMEMAYRLAVSEQPMIEQIRRNVIVLINPVSEPDGRDKVVDWFYRYLKGKTDHANLPETSPPYWGHYVYHDNNRDTHQKALALTQAVHRMFYDYHPTVVHDLHESIPLLQTWNGTGPWNANIDPIVINELFEMSFHEVRAMTALGMPGVWTWGFGEGWGHHYLDSVAINHNSVGRGYETFGNSSAETMQRTLRPGNESYVGKRVTERDWYRAWPPEKTFKWSLRNNTNYMQSGCLSILDYAAKNAKDMLRSFYRKGYNSWQKGLNEKPYAYVIPEDQGDPRRVAQMINLLMGHRIEVARATAPIKVKDGEFPTGSFVVRLDQPYRNYAVDLLSPQKLPESPYEPYDDVSWALPVHYGLEAKKIEDEAIKRAQLDPVRGQVRVGGKVEGSGPVFLLRDTGQEALLAARFRLARFDVEIAERPFKVGSIEYPAGSWVLPAQNGLLEALGPVADELGLDFRSTRSAPEVSRHKAAVPRVAVWHTWADTESVGWLRMTLDHQKIPYSYIRDEEIRAGNLRSTFDVVVFGNVYLDLKGMIHGIDTKFGPMPYTKTQAYPSHGVPDASDDITGGIGWAGMANLKRYLDEGGLLLTLGNGSALALEGGLVRGVSRASARDVNTPGVELRAKFLRPDHPIAYGYQPNTSAFRVDYPVYNVRPVDRRWIVLQWGARPPKDERDEEADDEGKTGEGSTPMVVSGGAKGTDTLEGNSAILDLPAGKGRVIAYNFNPMHRDLNRSDYRFLWNAVLNWNALPPAVP
jgi:hypothetical protein